MKAITAEVVETLVNLMRNILGNRAVDIILGRLGEGATGRELIYAFADETQNLLGEKGGFSSMRQLGRELARSIMSSNPRDKWEELLENTLNEFGFARKIEKEKDRAFICQCVFYEILEGKNLKPTEHSVCWAGWGFIEGFVKEMEGAIGIQWVERDYENEKCRFDFIFQA
ncbi:hypothetical protein [Persephonella sp.]